MHAQRQVGWMRMTFQSLPCFQSLVIHIRLIPSWPRLPSRDIGEVSNAHPLPPPLPPRMPDARIQRLQFHLDAASAVNTFPQPQVPCLLPPATRHDISPALSRHSISTTHSVAQML